MKTVQRLVLTLALVMLTNIITAADAYAKDEAAIVIVATGEFYALDSKKVKRKLQRRSKIFVGDTLMTGEDSRAQVRFIDGAVVALRPESELNIKKYSYGKGKQEEGSLMSLIKGGFRTITGAIGKEKYKVLTTMATIGIRGTHYEATIHDNQLYVALWDGGVSVKNNAGELDLGLGADYNYAMVQGENVEPQGQIDPPAAIVNDSQTEIAPDLSSKESSGSSSESGSSQTLASSADSQSLVSEDAWSDLASTSSSSSSSSINMPTTGIANYVNVASVSATGTTSSINNFSYNAQVDFAAATISGNMKFDSVDAVSGIATTHTWDVNFTGGPGTGNGVNGTGFSMNVDTASSNVDGFSTVSGTVSGDFAGTNAEQMVGSFSVVATNDTAVTATGTFTATQ